VDQSSFDRLARLLGEARDRRAGLKAALGVVLGGGAAVGALDVDVEARRKGRGGRPTGPDAGKRKHRKKTCKPACGTGYDCVKAGKQRVCDCATDVVCGDACCRVGQVCKGGACVAEPEPAQCIPAGEPCKGVGRRCCDGRVCASGQGGMIDIACYSPKTGACATTADCVFGTSCQDGSCRPGLPGPTPVGAPCAAGDTCASPAAVCTAYTADDAPGGTFCSLPLRSACSGDPSCTCYKCWYVNGGAQGTTRAARSSLNVKACCHPTGTSCTNEADCCSGLTCTNNVCTGDMCVPAGGACDPEYPCCSGSPCSGGLCPTCAAVGGSCASASCCDGLECDNDTCVAIPPCTVTVSTFSALKDALAAASTNSETAAQVICVTPGTYDFTETLTGTSKGTGSKTITIRKEGTGTVTFNGESTWDGTGTPVFCTAPNTPANCIGGRRILTLAHDAGCGGDCAGFVIKGIDFKNGAAAGASAPDYYGGCIYGTTTVTIKNAAFSRCAANYYGGAVHVEGTDYGLRNTSLTLRDVTLANNYATTYGGAIGAWTKNLSLTNVAVTDNYAGVNGGGIRNEAEVAGTTLTVNNLTMSGNAVGQSGSLKGGAGLAVSSGLTTATCSNQRNTTPWSIDDGVTAPMYDCYLEWNSSSGQATNAQATTYFANCGCKTVKGSVA